ncbi:Vitamin K-dependent protein C (Fragment) [Seminavis robusta]|uniref:Vitamin K-dependent protein C n=1 Tax=Seminavis robusta TaxID=568900 RepID=A0A9N8EUN2_9STRA
MFSRRTRHGLTFSVVFAAMALSLSSQQVQASEEQQQLRMTQQSQQQEQEQRQLGSVIIVDPQGQDKYDLEKSYPQYEAPQQEESQPLPQVPNNNNEELPSVRSGPHPSNEEINVKYQPDASKRHELFVSDRVVGGFGVGPRTWYSMLLYKDSAGWKFAGCGATLITNCHVLTAAHCVEDRNFDIEGIYNNAHTPYDGNSNHPFHFTSAQRIFVPQEYDDYTNVNDIAVIRMSECLNLADYAPAIPASPYNSHVSQGEMLELYGFGRLGENLGQSGDTKQLQMAQLPYIPNEQCKNYFGNKIRYGMFCAGFGQGGVDACQGDSGSGLLQRPTNPNDPYILTGIVSWGVGCARPGYPGVYAKVSDFYEWIKTNVCNDPELDPSITWCTDSPPENTLMLRQNDCSQNAPCGSCEGECNNDHECVGNLECFKRSGNTPFDLIPGCVGTGVATRNYCYDPNLSRFANTSAQGRENKPGANNMRGSATRRAPTSGQRQDTPANTSSHNKNLHQNTQQTKSNNNGRRKRQNGGNN